MRLPVIEMFTSVQGEGKYMGVPSHFIRVSGCNLRCVFRDSICDTPYSSFEPEKSEYEDVKSCVIAFDKLSHEHPNVKHIVITGGEPLLYNEALTEFLNLIDRKKFIITIETNGTRPALENGLVDLYSISPKLSTSVGKPCTINGIHITEEMIARHDNLRINIEVLTDFVVNSPDYQLKFVYSDENSLDEIDVIVARMEGHVKCLPRLDQGIFADRHPNKHIMLMPEGITTEQLDNKSKEIADICVERGWQFTDRLHIRIWGDERRK